MINGNLENLGLKINDLRYWRLTNSEFDSNDREGFLATKGKIVSYDSILSFKGKKWSLVNKILVDIFEGLFIKRQTPFQVFKEIKVTETTEKDLKELGIYSPVFNENVFLEILQKVKEIAGKEIAGGDIYDFTTIGKHRVPQRKGFAIPHLEEIVLEIGSPSRESGSLCGNNCSHCYWGNQREQFLFACPDKVPEEYLLKLSDYEKIIGWADQWNVPTVRLSGAPFKHWAMTRNIISKIIECGLNLEVHADTTFLKSTQVQELARCNDPQEIHIHISLEGSNPSINGIIRKSDFLTAGEMFEKIMEAIRLFSPDFPLSVGTCAHAGNIDGDWWAMFELLRPIIENWHDFIIYQPVMVGRLLQNSHLAATPEQIAEASMEFLKKWLERQDRKPHISTPLTWLVNNDNGIVRENLFLATGDGMPAAPKTTAFPRDRRNLYITPYGGVRMAGTDTPSYYLHKCKDLTLIWQDSDLQKIKNIPLKLIPECSSCQIGGWCRGGFMSDVSQPGWSLEKLLKKDERTCQLMRYLKEAHQLICSSL